MAEHRIYKMSFASIYLLYIKKVERKGKSKNDVDLIISWLTGYNNIQLQIQIEKEVDFTTFFNEAPLLNPNIDKIKGLICGHRIEEIEDELMRKIRCLDKLIDELAKGRKMDKILRT